MRSYYQCCTLLLPFGIYNEDFMLLDGYGCLIAYVNTMQELSYLYKSNMT